MSIRKNDLVVVISGDDAVRLAHKPAKVIEIYPADGRIVVEGVNRTYKHVKPSQKNPQGGKLSVELPIRLSNVMLYCGSCKRGVRTGRRYLDDGAKELFCRNCNARIRMLSKPRAAYAKKA